MVSGWEFGRLCSLGVKHLSFAGTHTCKLFTLGFLSMGYQKDRIGREDVFLINK